MSNPFRYSYRALIYIDCDHEDIWNALTDLGNYHIWNPFTPKVETNWQIGDKVILTVQMKEGKKPIKQIEYITRYDAVTELAWGMKWGIFLKAERVQQISIDTNGKTSYFTEDIIEGMLSPIVHLLYGKSIQAGFDALAKSLKKYIEKS
jgi:hypothetical protein